MARDYDDPRVRGLSFGAIGLDALAYAWALEHHTSVIPQAVISELASVTGVTGVTRVTGHLEECVTAGLWWRIHGGVEIDLSPDDRTRMLTAARMRRHRAKRRHAQFHGSVTSERGGGGGVSSSSVSSSPVPTEPQQLREQDRTQLQLVTSTGGGRLERDFDRFWKAYPNRKKKQAALKVWRRLKPGVALVETMLAAITKQATSPAWRKDGGAFIPHPATWLNAGQWEDDVGPTLAPVPAPVRPIRFRELPPEEPQEGAC